MQKYRPYYIWASGISHSGVEALKGFMEGNKVILPRLKEKNTDLRSITDPLQLTIGVLVEINNFFIPLYSINYEADVNMRLLSNIYAEFKKTLVTK